jgi:hypothetical protein
MSEKLFTKDEWDRALKGLGESYRVYVPVKEGDYDNFESLEEGKGPDFGFQNTRLSAKGLLYPESMRMFEYSLDPEDPEAHILKEAEKDATPMAVVGIRPCDAHAFEIVGRNFDTEGYRDPWWVEARERATLVGLGCNAPCSTCFCTSVGGGPFSEKGLDVLLTDLGDRILARGLTEKGEALLEKAGGQEPGAEDRKEAEALAREAAEKVPAGAMVHDRLSEKRPSGRRWPLPA